MLTPSHDFLVGIDSDGCAFDTMELKHKECFIPCTINHYKLQAVSKYAREAAEFVNLYSKDRGANRFPALIKMLKLLRDRAEVRARGVEVRIPAGLEEWIQRETRLGNPALQEAVSKTGDPDLAQALAWSKDVNATIGRVVRGCPPFPFVRECLEKLKGKADLLVVSATPGEALKREWQEHGIAQHVAAICGQETGTKKEILAVAKEYAPGKVLMVGDAPGDFQAARANGTLFFPINPGAEEASWQRLYEEGLDRFLSGTFGGEYEKKLIEEFDRRLPEHPSWKRMGRG
ncbi:MAG: HAD family hydrolase [Planctomycetia bacterium]|nr:HAD family hydrolase [Planctomycetia bacterium]